MPRPTQIRFLSPDDPRLKETRPPVSLIPVPIVRGLIRGVLGYLWTEERRLQKEKGVPQEKTEQRLMYWVEKVTREQLKIGDNQNDRILRVTAKGIPQLFQEMTSHSWIALNADSDMILKELAPYQTLSTPGLRLAWLQKELPRMLGSLKQGFCTAPSCTARTRAPKEGMLEKWAYSRPIGGLRDLILGYFHGLTKANVKRIRSSPP